MGFGGKLSKTISGFGTKISSGVKTLGNKTAMVEKRIQSGISKGIDVGQGAIRQTQRGIEQASGKVGAIKQGLNVGARVIDALQTTGVAGMVPGLAPTLAAVGTGLRAGSAGLQRVQDVGKSQNMALSKRSNQLAGVGKIASARVASAGESSRAKIERVGERAKAIEAQAQQDVKGVRSAFAS